MIGLGFAAMVLMVVVVAIVAAVGSSRRARGAAVPARPVPPGPHQDDEQPAPPELDLDGLLHRWRAAGLLDADQARAIARFEREATIPTELPPPPRRRVPVAAEALGYLGGALAVTGLVIVLSRYWSDLAPGARVAISGATALALLGAGAATRETDPALARLRGVLWLGSTVAAVTCAVVLADALGADDERILVLAGGAAATVAGAALWRASRNRPLQQVSCIAGAAVLAGAAADLALSGFAGGVAVWLVGAAFVALGLWGVTTAPAVDQAAGAIAVVVGGTVMAGNWEAGGLLIGVASVLALLAVAVVPRLAPPATAPWALGAVAAVGFVMVVPGTVGYFSQEAGVLTGIVVWLVGVGTTVLGASRTTRLPVVVELAGGIALLAGAAVTGTQAPGFASLFGVVTAVALLGFGMLPGQVLLSLLGAVGLLVNVPWAIAWWFPGEGRAPLLLFVAGLLLVGVAVLLTRLGGRIRREVPAGRRRGGGGPMRPSVRGT